jgi:hypothetical protein
MAYIAVYQDEPKEAHRRRMHARGKWLKEHGEALAEALGVLATADLHGEWADEYRAEHLEGDAYKRGPLTYERAGCPQKT